jgi:ribose 5-phosphate isomerase B
MEAKVKRRAMRIAVASDHRGFVVKGKILSLLAELGHVGIDYGPESSESVDYPDFAAKVALAISKHEVERGILICGTGMGMCIVANKFAGVRAAPCHDDLTAEMSRLHNDANVLCLSADLLGDRLVNRMVEIWLTTEFEGGRHARRLDKISQYEIQNGCCGAGLNGQAPATPVASIEAAQP